MLSSNTSAVSGDANYIEDVFSTYLYTGNATARSITNGVDLSTKGGLVWMKKRGVGTGGHQLYDTARGATKVLFTDATVNQLTYTNGLTAFGTTGFSIGSDSEINGSGDTQVSWSFAKAPKFFDVVTYTGNGVAGRAIPHSLGSVPGCIMVKATSVSGKNWFVYHRALDATAPEDYYLFLDLTNARVLNGNLWETPTSTDIIVNTAGGVNETGVTYVAYIFAHNAGGFGLTGTDNVISCGGWTAAAPPSGGFVNLGWEPQWIMFRRTDIADSWWMYDTMRGWIAPHPSDRSQRLYANSSAAEAGAGSDTPSVTSTGFYVNSDWTANNFIYIAIRRGPMKVPTDATKVFAPVAYTGTSATRTITGVGFPLDMNITMDRATHTYNVLSDRLRGLTCDGSATQPQLRTNATDAEASIANGLNGTSSSAMDGYTLYGAYSQMNASPDTYISYNFRRAPSFFDEVCPTVSGTIDHNLGVAPELIIYKVRNYSPQNWFVDVPLLGSTRTLNLNLAGAASSTNYITSPTATQFTTSVGGGGYNYVYYLFATCAGVSKVGGYTGTGTTKQVDCGFAAGARFVLIKRTDSTGDWYVWDTARGIVSGNDPYLLLNSTAAEVTSTDYIDAYSAGFELSSTAPAALNASGGSFVYLAIA